MPAGTSRADADAIAEGVKAALNDHDTQLARKIALALKAHKAQEDRTGF